MPKIKLWVDDVKTPPDDSWVWVESAMQAMYYFGKYEVTVASFDHDLGGGPDGYDLVKSLSDIDVWPTEGICVHTSNPVGRENMIQWINCYSPYKMTKCAKFYPNGYVYWDSVRKGV